MITTETLLVVCSVTSDSCVIGFTILSLTLTCGVVKPFSSDLIYRVTAYWKFLISGITFSFIGFYYTIWFKDLKVSSVIWEPFWGETFFLTEWVFSKAYEAASIFITPCTYRGLLLDKWNSTDFLNWCLAVKQRFDWRVLAASPILIFKNFLLIWSSLLLKTIFFNSTL